MYIKYIPITSQLPLSSSSNHILFTFFFLWYMEYSHIAAGNGLLPGVISH